MYSELKTFEAKLNIFVKQVSESNFSNFSCCNDLKFEKDENLQFSVEGYVETWNLLQVEFQNRFTDSHKYGKEIIMFQNPFEAAPEQASNFFSDGTN